MKELIKPNVINGIYELVNTNCPEQNIDGCPNLTCVCDEGGNTSIDIEDEFLF